MLYRWVLSFVGASVGAVYVMRVGFQCFLHLSMLACVLRLFPDLHAIHVVFSFETYSETYFETCSETYSEQLISTDNLNR